ncbi:hypothetical protein [Halorientalis litorea]|jgi:hypothetical protein|uniref:hypothetical protein n=1 Tax=Halorientalis litorea TaxID=2931977 RepID=UPI001FF5A1AA|nr:hypothetical protein [Halorientalis litorea]
MSVKQKLEANQDVLDQVAGFTGLGWTASVLGYLTIVIGYGNTLVTSPQSLLYLGGILFVTTFGLDRLEETYLDKTE